MFAAIKIGLQLVDLAMQVITLDVPALAISHRSSDSFLGERTNQIDRQIFYLKMFEVALCHLPLLLDVHWSLQHILSFFIHTSFEGLQKNLRQGSDLHHLHNVVYLQLILLPSTLLSLAVLLEVNLEVDRTAVDYLLQLLC